MVYVAPRRKGFSVEVPHTETATSGPIRRYPGDVGPELSYRGCFTCYELFRNAVAEIPDRPFLGHRPIDSEGNAGPYVFQSYGEVARRVDNFFSGLVHEELLPGNTDGLRLLGIYLKNCPEWIISDQAAFTAHAATVPLYDTLGPDSVAYVINQTELATVVCGPQELENLAAAASTCPSLKAAVLVAPALTDHHRHLARKGGLKLFCMLDLERLGFRYPQPHNPPNPEDIATFSYTSGTTGGPKGALITHRNLISVYASAKALEITQLVEDVHMSYLPLPHVFERVVEMGVIGNGAGIGYWQGSPEKLLDDLQALRPTEMPAVPRVLNRIYDKIMQGVRASSKTRQAIFRKALSAKLHALRTRGELGRGTFWDKLVFAKIRKALGWDRMRLMVTGSAPLAPHVLDFMRVLLACPIHEGYGQTETTAMTTITFPHDWTTGHVGGVVPVCEVKLVDVPEMGYLHTDRQHGARSGQGKVPVPCVGRGEICVRGPHVFHGYYRMPEKTAEAIDEDGWLHSGDIGMWDLDGHLVIIDRKKNIFKLAQGEYVAAEKIENVMTESGLIMQAFVYGDSLKSELVAIVVPDPESLREWAKENGLGDVPHEQLCRQPLLMEKLMTEIQICSKRAGLHGFEIPKAIYVESEVFSPGNGLLTPTQKLRRVEARDRYMPIIDELYAKLDAKPDRSRL